ncbi:MAG: tetratricopeptide repeat protein [Ignavibacteriales bacterium]|nr:tetratricopeptide repeat protein [Ignavibacteriales bacterium]
MIELQRDHALQHFVEGAALDAKGSFAEAILEYQEALQSDPNASIYFAISRDYLLLNKFDRAVEAAGEAVRLEPQNISYRENLGTIYFNASRVDLAIHEYEEIVRIDSNATAAWIALANLYQQIRPLKALEIYEKMLERNGEQLDILFQCAQLYSAIGRFDEAATKYKRMLELDPTNKPLQKQLAETFAKSGKLDQARSILETMVESDSSDAEVVATLADVYLDQKRFQNAIDLYEKLLNRGIKNTGIKLRIALGFFGLTEHDSTLIQKAQGLFEDLHKEIPNDWRPCWYLGALAANQHKDSLAGTYFEQVTKLEEHHADAWWFLGSSLFEQGKYNKLLEEMEQAQKVLPNDFRFYLLQGLALTRMEKQEDAVPPLKKAYILNPKDLNTLSSLALTLDGLHRYQESDSLYEEGLKLDPKSALLLNNYGYSLAERGLQLRRALEMSKQAVTAEPDNSAYLDTYGWIFFRLKNYKDAAGYIEKSVATGKASAVVHEHLGDVYLKLGRKEQAIELWKKALEMDPKNEAVKEKILHGAI